MSSHSSESFVLSMPVAIIIAGLAIGGALIWSTYKNTGAQGAQAAAPQTVTVDIATVSTSGEPFIGDANAPMTIAFWSDFQCPYCRAFEVGNPQIPTPAAFPQVIEQYVKTGKVKVVFKDFEFLGPASMVDAEYGRAVWALYPDQYYAWRTAMYNGQPEENSLSVADNLAWILKTTKSIAGIDVNKVSADVAAHQSEYDAAITADRTEAAKYGINATPSFVIGKQMIAGAYPFATFQQAIDAAASGK